MIYRNIYVATTVLILLSISSLIPAADNTSILCNRLFPQQGKWTDYPPYWKPRGCSTQPFGIDSTIACMKGRTFYVIGNSVARQSAFEMVNLLGGGDVKREGQKELCPKHETFWGDSCHSEFAGVSIRYLHVQWMDGFDYSYRGGFPFLLNPEKNGVVMNSDGSGIDYYQSKLPNKPSDIEGMKDAFWEAGNCIETDMHSCLETFFNGSTPNDVLFFQVGMAYSSSNKEVDNLAWARASAANFKANIKSTFPGIVFRQTGEQLLHQYAHQTPQFREVDKAIWEVMRPMSEKESKMWYTIDQWAINKGRDHLYNDHVHFVGPLNTATVMQVLNMLCPGRGDSVLQKDYRNKVLVIKDKVDSRNEDSAGWNTDVNDDTNSIGRNSSADSTATITSSTVAKVYFADSSGYLRMFKNGENSACPALVKSSGTVYGDSSLISGTIKLDPFPDVCQEGKLLQAHGQKQVFLVHNNTLQPFMSSAPFFRMGLDFGDVVFVDGWIIDAFQKGKELY